MPLNKALSKFNPLDGFGSVSWGDITGYFTGQARLLASSVISGLVSGITGGNSSVASALGGIVQNAINYAREKIAEAFSPSRVMIRFGRDLVAGLTIGIQKNGKFAVEALRTLLSNVRGVVRDFKDSISSGFAFDVTGMPGMTDANGNAIAPGRKAIRRYARQQVQAYRRFAQALQKIARMGAPPGLLQDLVAAGPEGGLEIARVLANSPKLLRQVGGAERRIDRLGRRTAGIAANQMTFVFQGNVYGFNDFEKAVSKAIHKAIQRKKKK